MQPEITVASPGRAGAAEVAAIAAVRALLAEEVIPASSIPPNIWGAAGRMEAMGLRLDRALLRRGWRQW